MGDECWIWGWNLLNYCSSTDKFLVTECAWCGLEISLDVMADISRVPCLKRVFTLHIFQVNCTSEFSPSCWNIVLVTVLRWYLWSFCWVRWWLDQSCKPFIIDMNREFLLFYYDKPLGELSSPQEKLYRKKSCKEKPRSRFTKFPINFWCQNWLKMTGTLPVCLANWFTSPYQTLTHGLYLQLQYRVFI